MPVIKSAKEKTSKAYLGLGSNLGKRLGNIRSAVAALEQVPGIAVIKVSSIYETQPMGNINQPKYLNSVAEVETNLSASELLTSLQRIEKHMGRQRLQKWEPRIIDLDILYYDQLIVDTKELSIPHPELAKRAFVLIPLSEIAPDFRDPLSKKKVGEMISGIDIKSQGIKKLDKSRY